MVLSMDRWKGKVAVITGASAGIGAAIAEKLVNEGINVVGLARRKEKLLELSNKLEGRKGKFYFVQADATKEDDIVAAFNWVKSNVGPIHILVNNAGLFVMTNLTEGITELWKKVLDTNVLGLCIATREAVKMMRENNIDGHIIHINSMAGHSVTTWQMNIYAASKHAVTALTETLRQELNSFNSNIKISSVSPAYVATEIINASSVTSGVPIPDNWKDWEKNAPALQPEDIADAIGYILSTPPKVQVHELKLRAIK